jgi:hypothetical protein
MTRRPSGRAARELARDRKVPAGAVLALAVVLAVPSGLARATPLPGAPSSPPAPASHSGTPLVASPAALDAVATPSNPDCLYSRDALDRANELMHNRYRLGSFPAVTLPANPSWTENPLHDDNWRFQLHSLRFTLDLFTAARETGNMAYRDRALAIIRDWIHDNPRHGSPTIWSWNDHATAFRAIVLSCTADMTGMTTWLRSALLVHGATLADPSFYVRVGNHALNQAMGLLEVGRVLGRSDWMSLAGTRIDTLLAGSVDAQGVTNEQAIFYELYNYGRYTRAQARMVTLGLTPGSAFTRLKLMPSFLAQATLPNGHYEMLGDTNDGQATSIPGTDAEYAATRGARGTRPTRLISRYSAGYLFVRSGWGVNRPLTDETFMAVKYGRGATIHGHADGMELTLAAYGTRLLVDPGMYSYTPSAYRTFFKGRSAHNIVTVDGKAWTFSAPSKLLSYRASDGYVDIRMQTAGYSGVTHTRRITYSRPLNFILVEDRLSSATAHSYRQLWHLMPDARPAVSGTTLWTRRTKGNVVIRQLAGRPVIRIVTGRTSPIQGWYAPSYGHKVAAPVEEAVLRGSSVRFLTLILPGSGFRNAVVSGLRLTSTGYTVTVRIGSHAERVTVSGSSIWTSTLS